jgi:hypothetical protein
MNYSQDNRYDVPSAGQAPGGRHHPAASLPRTTAPHATGFSPAPHRAETLDHHPEYGRPHVRPTRPSPMGRYPAAPSPQAAPRHARHSTGPPRTGRHAQTPPSSSPPHWASPQPTEEPDDSSHARTDAKLARQVAAVASLAAGVVHTAATPAHWEEWILAGLFFSGTAAFQLLWGLVAIPFGNTFLRASGLLANLGILGLWALSRLNGMPFGPGAGVPEPVGTADLIAAALGTVIVAGLLWSLLPRERHGVLASAGYRAGMVVAFIAVTAAAVPGAAAALAHSHAHDGAETADHDDGAGHSHDGDEEMMDMDSSERMDSDMSAEADESAPAEEDHTHAPGEEHD